MPDLREIPTLKPLLAVAALFAILAAALLVDDGVLLVAPTVAFLWLLVIGYKGYLHYGLPLFAITTAIYVLWPEPITATVLLWSMILLACLPARRKVEGRWQVAGRDGRFKNWLLPAGPDEDIGAFTGDASIHLMVILGLAVTIGLALNGFF
jgi:hypothetical protein